MSRKHPVIAVTGSSGAGTTFVKQTFENIFRRKSILAAFIEGDSYHSVTRGEFKQKARDIPHFSHFGPEANDFHGLERLFHNYGASGTGEKRYYLHNDAEAFMHRQRLAQKGIRCDAQTGEFTPWEPVPGNTDLLFYEGLHGMVRDDSADKRYGGYDVAGYVDLGIGVVPGINLEWIQKIHRDNTERGYEAEEIVDTMLRRMPDYINHITPQFSRTHINFQRVPTVDTSNPFIARDIPGPDESLVVIGFDDPERLRVDFTDLMNNIQHAFKSRQNTLVVPGGEMELAMELILTPIIEDMIAAKDCA